VPGSLCTFVEAKEATKGLDSFRRHEVEDHRQDLLHDVAIFCTLKFSLLLDAHLFNSIRKNHEGGEVRHSRESLGDDLFGGLAFIIRQALQLCVHELEQPLKQPEVEDM